MSRNRFCAFIAGPLLIALIAASHPVAHAQTFSILYNFGTNSGDPPPLNLQESSRRAVTAICIALRNTAQRVAEPFLKLRLPEP